MKNVQALSQLFLRIVLAIGFILPVMDRFGLMGNAGTSGVAWGDWKHFVDYSNTLMPFLSRSSANILGCIATVCEVIFAICLFIGFQIKYVALGAALLTFVFGICMAIFLNLHAPFTYPVFVFTGAALVLSGLGSYKWSIDDYLNKKKI